MSQNFHNQIASLSINHFNNLPKKGKPNINEWTVLSCIVQENKLRNHFEVVALGTGSKCIGKGKMSPKGDILNDSHAEVICRRAFLCYIYKELSYRNLDLFNFDLSKCSLSEDVRFHFFTSHVPCGDAAIFLKQNSNEFGEVVSLKRCIEDDVVNVKRCKVDGDDIYRTGAKCLPQGQVQDLHGNGVEYHTLGVVRTKPGRGDPTLSVSCSDKLARWCHIGLQGALLTRILSNPIYLSSFTIVGDTPFNEESLRRALYGRLNIEKPPIEMVLGQASVPFKFCKTESNIPSPTSIVWFKSKTSSLEVSVDGFKQGVTKKDRGTKAARLRISKIELFRTYLNTVKVLFSDVRCDDFYDETKTKAVEYQRAWSMLKKEGFKCWTIKDENLQHFTLD
ncbi:hypothetical protein RN001_014950 [Aquatica leii]|uniref:tRNA-specific adenosine deaminase 1 n=1 Tax=Aquatica leii TaxID=1421715 RepID=A0AAN7P0B2_9COLE|nr:hypothetical protein RN001_014950 [Aquatica leii]